MNQHENKLWLLLILCVFGTIWAGMTIGTPSSEHKAKMEELKEQSLRIQLIHEMEQEKAMIELNSSIKELRISTNEFYDSLKD